jgi:hypothetical protein
LLTLGRNMLAQAVIAKETAAQLSLGTNITNAKGLPGLPADGKVPNDLGKKYGPMILAADGFAEVRPWPPGVPLPGAVVLPQRPPALHSPCPTRTAQLYTATLVVPCAELPLPMPCPPLALAH